MLIRLLPEQVNENWEVIAPLISLGQDPEVGQSRQGMVNVLRAILMEQLVCWAYVEDKKFIFLLCTQIRTDKVTLDRQLLIFSFTSIREVSNRILKRTFAILTKYARSNDCRTIIGYVDNEQLTNLYVREFNANADYKFVEVPV